MKKYIFILAVGSGLVMAAHSAILPLETYTFDSTTEDWTGVNLDAAPTSVDGRLTGTITQDDPFSPVEGAFRRNINFAGLLAAEDPGTSFYNITFNFYTALVIPSELSLRIGNDDNLYTIYWNVASLLPATDNLITFSLMSANNWIGGNDDFFTVLNSATYAQVGFLTSQEGAQTFAIDNFTINGTDGVPSAIPEPTTISLLLFVVLLLAGARRIRGVASATA